MRQFTLTHDGAGPDKVELSLLYKNKEGTGANPYDTEPEDVDLLAMLAAGLQKEQFFTNYTQDWVCNSENDAADMRRYFGQRSSTFEFSCVFATPIESDEINRRMNREPPLVADPIRFCIEQLGALRFTLTASVAGSNGAQAATVYFKNLSRMLSLLQRMFPRNKREKVLPSY
jgi:hypothetical protein